MGCRCYKMPVIIRSVGVRSYSREDVVNIRAIRKSVVYIPILTPQAGLDTSSSSLPLSHGSVSTSRWPNDRGKLLRRGGFIIPGT
jgi:hypothetical protein